MIESYINNCVANPFSLRFYSNMAQSYSLSILIELPRFSNYIEILSINCYQKRY